MDVPEEFAPQYTDENGNVRPPENFAYYDPIPGKLPIVCNGGYDTAAEAAIFESVNPGNKPAYEKMEKELKEFITKSTNEIVDCGFNMSLRYMWRPIYFRGSGDHRQFRSENRCRDTIRMEAIGCRGQRR